MASLFRTSVARAESRFGSYNFDHPASGYVIDPTGPDGQLLPEYVDVPVFRVNEPNRNELPNSMFCHVLDSKGVTVVALFSTKPIKAGEEVLALYGDQYLRLY